MSFQAYLDNIEDKTGLTPRQFMGIAHDKGYDQPDVKSAVIVSSSGVTQRFAGEGWW
jgi:hypothetical protein